MARSSTKAKYKSIAFSATELIWLQIVLCELGLPLSRSPMLWCDNVGAMYLAANLVYHSRTKHMDIDFHFVWDRVAAKSFVVSFINSKDQIADIFTK